MVSGKIIPPCIKHMKDPLVAITIEIGELTH